MHPTPETLTSLLVTHPVKKFMALGINRIRDRQGSSPAPSQTTQADPAEDPRKRSLYNLPVQLERVHHPQTRVFYFKTLHQLLIYPLKLCNTSAAFPWDVPLHPCSS